MKFPEETRKAIYASGGRALEIDWPEGRVLPEPHRSYTVQSSERAGQLSILVIRSLDDGLRALVQIDADPVRIPGKSGGYTSRSSHALSARVAVDPERPLQFRPEHEPEALSAAETAEMGRQAKRQRVERIQTALAELYEQLSELQDDPDFSHHRSDVRFLCSLTRKLETRLTREDIRYIDDLQEAS